MGTTTTKKGRPAGTGGRRRAGTAGRARRAKDAKAKRERGAVEALAWFNRMTSFLDDLQRAVAAIRWESRKPGSLAAAMFNTRALIDLEVDLNTAACSMCGCAPVLRSGLVPPPAAVAPEPDPRD